jgi:hypothetical protein
MLNDGIDGSIPLSERARIIIQHSLTDEYPMPKTITKAKNIKKTAACHTPPIDIFSLGHFAFGLNVAGDYLLISYFMTLSFQFSLTFYVWSLIIGWIVSLAVFTSWEFIEHLFVKDHIYIAKLGKKDWCETRMNSIMDVVVAFIAFNAYYLPLSLFMDESTVVWTAFVLSTIITMIVALHIRKK